MAGLIKPEGDWLGSLWDNQPDEFRLFWKTAMFHAVCVNDEWKWFYCKEDESSPRKMLRKENTVYTRQDFERFGLTKDNVGNLDNLRLVEYWDGKRLVAWRVY